MSVPIFCIFEKKDSEPERIFVILQSCFLAQALVGDHGYTLVLSYPAEKVYELLSQKPEAPESEEAN